MRGVLSVVGLVCLGIGLFDASASVCQTRRIVAWGGNDCGQILIPLPDADYVALAGGHAHSLGLKSDGTVAAWGYNECGQCDVPAPNAGFVSVAAGGGHSLGVKIDGTVVAWGCNDFGQCDVPAPNGDFVAVAAGEAHSLGLKSDGTIVAWGDNDFGQSTVPLPNADFVALAAGAAHSLGLKSDGTIIAWGYNGDGQCNVPLPDGAFVGLAGGGAHSLGLKSDGTVVAWGDSAAAQCNVPDPNADFVAVAAGNAHSLGLKSDGTIVAWGANGYLQCTVPIPNANFVAVAAGSVHSLGVRSMATLFVNQAAAGADDGSSWTDAYTDLQSALAIALPGTSVWVAAGTYRPTTGTDRAAAFALKNGVALYGGFAGTETALESRDWSANTTVLSGDIGVPSDSTDNSYHVVIGSGLDSTAVFDGFTVTSGRADGVYPSNSGGGMYIDAAGPTIGNARFWRNSAVLGGAVANRGGDPVFANTLFTENLADTGGAVFNFDGAGPKLTSVTFSGNAAGSFGGAMFNSTSAPTLINAILWGDSAVSGGDEIFNTQASNPEISYSLIAGCGGSGGWNLSFGSDGGHNKDADPMFADPSGGDFRPTRPSPGVNAGGNSTPHLRETDLDGNPRIVWDVVDMGAYEYQGSMGPVIYVDWSATGNDNGYSWTDAYSELRSALSAAGSGDSIWVAAGTYKPTAGTDRTASFCLKNGVALLGGFDGSEITHGERNWMVNETVLSGDIGIEGISADNSHHVTTGTGNDSTAVLDGFAITGGTADEDTIGGGGMIIWQGSPTVRNTVFRSNSARTGGALQVRGNESRPRLLNVSFSGNTASELGGGLMNEDHAVLTLVNAVFSGNSSAGPGGGIHNRSYAQVTLVNVTFSGNTAAFGGAISNDEQAAASLFNAILWADSAATGNEIWNSGGGAAFASFSLVEGSGGSGGDWDASLGSDGGFNIDVDPEFVDLPGGNFRLTLGSPAVDAGTAAAPGLPASDFDGYPRTDGPGVDLGAFELQQQVYTGIEETRIGPRGFRIESVSPNPFNPSTSIRFTLPAPMPVTAAVWSVTGARVAVLARNNPFPAGDNRLVWDGRNDSGSPAASGVYFVRIETRAGVETVRAVLLK